MIETHQALEMPGGISAEVLPGRFCWDVFFLSGCVKLKNKNRFEGSQGVANGFQQRWQKL